jgi:hypothetical protein
LRAAQAVGRLAAYDFARVMDTMFKRWITAGTASALRAISWAVELMIDDPRTAQAVWERTRIWSTMSLPWQRAALVVYGDHLQPQQTTEALELVRRVAARSSNLDYTAVSVLPRAMKVGAGDAVFDLLKEWLNQINRNQQRPPRQLPDDVVGTTALAVHAARAFVLLATGTRKQLVRAANADPVVAEMLASLCRLAITIPAVATRGTTVLSWWLRDSQSDDDLAIACKRLLDALSRDPSTRRRLRYYAARWITGWAGAYPIAEDLVRSTLAKQTGHDERTR